MEWMNEQTRDNLANTDFLTDTLREDEAARKEIFAQMLYRLELRGECRTVYHRLAYVLFGDTLRE